MRYVNERAGFMYGTVAMHDVQDHGRCLTQAK